MKKQAIEYTSQETARYKAIRNNQRNADRNIGIYEKQNNGQYRHTITKLLYDFFSANRTMALAK